MGASKAEAEFSALQFEKSLTNLKDSQESINQCCQWCLSNRQHYKKIINSWLNVIKRVKIEQRVVLFYLANDVVQYSKRRNYDYVDTWGTAIQKATTLVRDEKVKHKILRIFKIWEQRGVYGDEFISDLCGLINIQPTGPKNDEPHEFQSSYVINKIKNCSNLEKDTDAKMRLLKEHNPKIQFTEGLINSLKDRAHVDDVEKELDVYVEHMEGYINALKVEIKNRIALISVLKQAETQLESDRKDVKTVAHAYKTYGQRVKNVQKRLEEHLKTLPSPIPSPDINAPSPSPEEDIELPEDDTTKTSLDTLSFSNPGYYVPPPTTNSLNVTYSASVNSSMVSNAGADTSTSFLSNGFTSFLGQNLSFNISNISTTGLFNQSMSEDSGGGKSLNNSYDTPPKPVAPPSEQTVVDLTGDIDNPAPYNPLLPPPMPPFTKGNEAGFGFNTSVDVSSNVIAPYDPAYQNSAYLDTSYNVDTSQIEPSFDYNSLTNPSWNDGNECDTPESPPTFEKEGYADPIEYHDGVSRSNAVDVDHRVIPGMGDLEDSLSSLGGKDVDHRNLISLTGSPGSNLTVNGQEPPALPERGNLKTITPQETVWQSLDQDYRTLPPLPPTKPPPPPSVIKDQDYRMQFDLKAPPPPPPPTPPKAPSKRKPPPPPPLPAPGAPGDPRLRCAGPSPRKNEFGDDEDMDLSEDFDNSGAQFLDGDSNFSLEPPPPFPDLLDDMDANEFLDDISSDLNEFSNLAGDVSQESENGSGSSNGAGLWDSMRLPPPPFGMTANSPAFTPGIPPPPSPGNYMMDVRQQQPPHPNHGLLPAPHPDNPPMPPQNYVDNPYLEEATYNRGGQHNFRGRFPRGPPNFSPSGFRGRGRGRGGSPWTPRGGMRGRGGLFRPRGNFRGRMFNRGGF